MPIKDLGAGSAQLKKARDLAQAKNRSHYGQQLVEGVQAVRELLSCAPEQVRDVFTSPELLAEHEDIAALLSDLDPYVHLGEAELISKAAPSAQGIFAVAEAAPAPSLDAVLGASKLLVCCVQLQDPGNLGTIIRTADAAGAGGVLLGSGSADPTSPKVIRSAAGSTFHIPVWRDVELRTAVTQAHEAGFQVLAADGCGDAQLGSAGELDLAQRNLWMIGNEAHGFTAEQLALADQVVRIPMWGKAESLNAAVAAALCLYASAQVLSQ